MSIGTSNYAAGFIITNFLLASLVFSARPIKNYLKIDRNIAPREDLSKYGATEVQKGRLSQETLDVLKRLEACHANAMEHLPFFIGTMLFALHARLPSGTINFAGIAYTVSRTLYTGAYAYGTTLGASYIRSLFWWASSLVCIVLLIRSGKAINA